MDMVRKGFGNKPLKDLTMERKRVEEFEESLNEDWGWINLVFLYSFSLKILSRSSLSFMGKRGIYTGVRMECEKLGFFKTGLVRGLALRVDWVASSSREVTERPVVLFCPIVLQLAWCFNFWHAWHVSSFWRLAAASHPRDPVASLYFSCTLLSISSHYLTHYPYKNPT